MTDTERAVLEAYREQEGIDPEGAYTPYFHAIARAAGGDAGAAYAACKLLKKAGLLEAGGRQGPGLSSAPPYWITDKGKEALR